MSDFKKILQSEKVSISLFLFIECCSISLLCNEGNSKCQILNQILKKRLSASLATHEQWASFFYQRAPKAMKFILSFLPTYHRACLTIMNSEDCSKRLYNFCPSFCLSCSTKHFHIGQDNEKIKLELNSCFWSGRFSVLHSLDKDNWQLFSSSVHLWFLDVENYVKICRPKNKKTLSQIWVCWK